MPGRQREGSGQAPWLRWMLLGCVGWVVLTIVLDEPIGLLATPAAAPILGWLVGAPSTF